MTPTVEGSSEQRNWGWVRRTGRGLRRTPYTGVIGTRNGSSSQIRPGVLGLPRSRGWGSDGPWDK